MLRIAMLVAGLGVIACQGEASTLDPAGPRAATVARLAWVMTAAGVLVFVAVVAALLVAIRRSSSGAPLVAAPSDARIIVAGGIVLPAIVIPLLWAMTLADIASTATPPSPAVLTVEVTGHQWWYEVRYPDQGVSLVNEMRIPAGRVVALRITSADVIHSFWIPRLTGKIDMIPGRVNDHWVMADSPGRYPVACAEFCGIAHARMRMEVLAERPEDFERWLSERR
ncbi:MAG TPA: cytochrome c oxidase subunit II [Candidatus Limnocylindria bacterium]|nr:cytochrome c oxidase subunit II [Candidatus Limnocylindria bacterium]